MTTTTATTTTITTAAAFYDCSEISSTSDTNLALQSVPQFQPCHIPAKVGSQNIKSLRFIATFPATVPTNPTPQIGQFWFCMLQFCPKQVNVSFGCLQRLTINGNICKPPHDLVIVFSIM